MIVGTLGLRVSPFDSPAALYSPSAGVQVEDGVAGTSWSSTVPADRFARGGVSHGRSVPAGARIRWELGTFVRKATLPCHSSAVESQQVQANGGPERCPGCGSADLRRSFTAGMRDAVMQAFSFVPWRCRACERRFYRRLVLADRASLRAAGAAVVQRP